MTNMTQHPEAVKMMNLLASCLKGERGADQQRIAEVGLSWLDLLLRKNQDYGSTIFRQPRMAPKCDPATAILVRMGDKVDRLTNLLAGNVSEVAESIEDNFRDLGAYCLLYLARPVESGDKEAVE